VDRAGTWSERRGGASHAEANVGEGSKDLGGGVGKRGSRDRLAEAASASRLSGVAEEMGCGTYFLVGESESVPEQGL